MSYNRNRERNRSYALTNPYVAWVYVHSEVLAWQEDEQILNGSGEILTVVNNITTRWFELPRPRPSGLREFVGRYLNAAGERFGTEEERRSGWATHVASLPPGGVPSPAPDAPRKVGRVAAYALTAAQLGGQYTLTRNLMRRYGHHTVAALFDAGLIAPDVTPLTLHVTDLGSRVLLVLTDHDVSPTGCDLDRWRNETRGLVAAIVNQS